MQIPLDKRQRDHLRSVRQAQLADWMAGRPQVVDDLFVQEEVVRLMSGMGRAAYLGLDGRVWVGNLGEGSREMPEEIMPRATDGFRYFCRRCGGLGWTQSEG